MGWGALGAEPVAPWRRILGWGQCSDTSARNALTPPRAVPRYITTRQSRPAPPRTPYYIHTGPTPLGAHRGPSHKIRTYSLNSPYFGLARRRKMAGSVSLPDLIKAIRGQVNFARPPRFSSLQKSPLTKNKSAEPPSTP